MASITIRGVDEQARAELAARAARRGQSMQEFLRLLLETEADRPDLDEVLRRIARRTDAISEHVEVAEILNAKDADRR